LQWFSLDVALCFSRLLQYCVLRCCFSCFNLHVVLVCFVLLQQLFGVVVHSVSVAPSNTLICTIVLIVATIIRCCCTTLSMVFRLLHPMLQSSCCISCYILLQQSFVVVEILCFMVFQLLHPMLQSVCCSSCLHAVVVVVRCLL
jgi:hypothetical protein